MLDKLPQGQVSTVEIIKKSASSRKELLVAELLHYFITPITCACGIYSKLIRL